MSNMCLNFLWIHQTQLDHSIEPRIPDQKIENMCDMAAGHPDVDRFFWLDFDRIAPDQLQAIRERVVPFGLQVVNLRDVPAYAETEFFDITHTGAVRDGVSSYGANGLPKMDYGNTIWGQVDLARVMVLRHCLKEHGYDSAFYSDMDIRAFNLRSQKLHSVFDRHEVVFAAGGEGHTSTSAGAEQGFMGFGQRALDKLETLYDGTYDMCVEEKKNGYLALGNFLKYDCPELRGQKLSIYHIRAGDTSKFRGIAAVPADAPATALLPMMP